MLLSRSPSNARRCQQYVSYTSLGAGRCTTNSLLAIGAIVALVASQSQQQPNKLLPIITYSTS